MAKYTARVTNDENGIQAWVDMDGSLCIVQPNAPGLEGNWATEADAQAWATEHAAQLEAAYEAAAAEAAQKKEREEAAHQANLAMVAILERLTNPTA